MAAKRKGKQDATEVVGFLGVGLDADEGHRRMTTGENFVLVGGSEETHERMIATAMGVNEQLRLKGKRLGDATPEELRELFDEEMKRRLP